MAVHLFSHIPNEKNSTLILETFNTIEELDQYTGKLDSVEKLKKRYKKEIDRKYNIYSKKEEIYIGIWNEQEMKFYVVFTKYENQWIKACLRSDDFMYHLSIQDYKNFQMQSTSKRIFSPSMSKNLYYTYQKKPYLFRQFISLLKKEPYFRDCKEKILYYCQQMTEYERKNYQLPLDKNLSITKPLIHSDLIENENKEQKLFYICKDGDEEVAYLVSSPEELSMYDERPKKLTI